MLLFVKDINLGDRAEYIRKARVVFDSYGDNWRLDYFDDNSGGYLVTERGRIIQSEKSKNEIEKFHKEHEMCKTLAKNGYAMEYLDDQWGKSYDVHVNTIKADLKKTVSHNNLVRYAKKAIREQGAEMVVFEFDNMTGDIHKGLNKLESIGIKVMYYTSANKNKIIIL